MSVAALPRNGVTVGVTLPLLSITKLEVSDTALGFGFLRRRKYRPRRRSPIIATPPTCC